MSFIKQLVDSLLGVGSSPPPIPPMDHAKRPTKLDPATRQALLKEGYSVQHHPKQPPRLPTKPPTT